MLTYHLIFIIQVADDTSSANILWEDLLQAEMDKLAAMPELQETEKIFWAELDYIEEVSCSWHTPIASSLWKKSPVRDSETEKQPPALVTFKVVSRIRSHMLNYI